MCTLNQNIRLCEALEKSPDFWQAYQDDNFIYRFEEHYVISCIQSAIKGVILSKKKEREFITVVYKTVETQFHKYAKQLGLKKVHFRKSSQLKAFTEKEDSDYLVDRALWVYTIPEVRKLAREFKGGK